MTAFLFTIFQLLLVPALSPLAIGVTRKVKARLQNRQGARIIQPYRDLYKLFGKDEVISEDASWIFRFAPYAVFASTWVVAASIPLVALGLVNGLTGDMVTIVYLFAFSTFLLALAGMDTGSAFGGFGASREMMVTAFTEGGLLIALFALAEMAHSTNLGVIAGAIEGGAWTHVVPLVLAFLAFFIALLAETARYPFDNPATHLELTMIHEAMILEYSGKRLALMEWAAANKYLIFIALGANLFFPWGIAGSLSSAAILLGFCVFVLKLGIFCTVIGVLESSMAKLRIFRLPDLLFTSLALGVIAIGLLI